MPKILPHSIQVFLDSESLASSNGLQTLKNEIFSSQQYKGRPIESIPSNTHAVMNSNNASWKLLQAELVK